MANDITGTDILLTVFLKHDQSQALDEFQAKLDARRWWQNFPPDGVEVVSWNVVMGIGQIVTLRLPPDRLQAVNVALEKYAWGVFRTETFISYDFMAVRERLAGESATRQSGQAEAPDREIPSGAGGSHHPRLPLNGLSLNDMQSKTHEPTAWEQQVGDTLEAAFKAGHHELPDLVAALNAAGVPAPEGEAWSESAFEAVMQKLGAGESMDRPA
jgi:uncharacterized protein with GYD domain